MTQDEILEMVREAGGSDVGGPGWTTWVGTQSTEFLERFAKLIAAKEREECADLLEFGYIDDENHHLQYAYEIRARGKQA